MTDQPRLLRPVDLPFEQAYRQFHGHRVVTLALRITDYLCTHNAARAGALRSSSHNLSAADARMDRLFSRSHARKAGSHVS